jgi:hypothetical protein
MGTERDDQLRRLAEADAHIVEAKRVMCGTWTMASASWWLSKT